MKRKIQIESLPNQKMQQGGPLLPNNPSGYTDSVINANQNIPFYRDVKAGKIPKTASTFFYDAADNRAMEDDNTNPYNGIRSGVKPHGSYQNGQYNPLAVGDAYSDTTTAPIYFPSQQAAGTFQNEINNRIKGVPKKQQGGKLKKFTDGGPSDNPLVMPDGSYNSSTYNPTATGVVPNNPQVQQGWNEGMSNKQMQQNIDYGAGSTNAYDPNTGNTDNGSGSLVGQQRQRLYQSGQNVLGEGLMDASFMEDRRNQKNMAGYQRQQGISDNVFGAEKLNTQGSKGNYNQQGIFRPNANTIYQPGLQYGTAQMGGSIGEGIHDLDENTIASLRAKGYKIEYIN